MIYVLPAAVSVAAALAPIIAMPILPVAVAAGAGVLLVALALTAGWRWPATVAACVFLTDYAGARWLIGGPADLVAGAALGLLLLLLLETVDIACRARRTIAQPGVTRSTLLRAASLGAATLALAALVGAPASALAAFVPAVASPVLAAAGALGLAVALAAVIARAVR